MLTTPSAQNKPAKDIPFPPFNGSLALQAFQPLMTGLVESNGKACASWLDMNRQWTAFVTQRLQEDVALVHRLANCASPMDVYGVYSDFFQKALADYQREFTEMMRLGQMCFAQATLHAQKAE